MSKKLIIALCATLAALPLAGCNEGGYGGGVAVGYNSPYSYNGYYDDYYGPIYDGYWGSDGGFYYRSNQNERGYHRGDTRHFTQTAPAQGNYHPFQGTMTPQPGTRMPHFRSSNTRRH
jgi:hypothetical protein